MLSKGAAEPSGFHNLSPNKYVVETYLAPKNFVNLLRLCGWGCDDNSGARTCEA